MKTTRTACVGVPRRGGSVMSGWVTRRVAAIGSLILPAVAPTAAHHPGSGSKTGSGPTNIITVAARYELIPGQLEDAAPPAGAGHGKNRHSFRSIESFSLAAAFGITNDNMVAIRIPHMRRSDTREAAEEHSRPRPNDDVATDDARLINASRTAVARRFA
jgi:hypothetical protein